MNAKYKEQSSNNRRRVKLIARKTKPFRQLNACHSRSAPDTGSTPKKVTSRLDQMIIKIYIISVLTTYRNT